MSLKSKIKTFLPIGLLAATTAWTAQNYLQTDSASQNESITAHQYPPVIETLYQEICQMPEAFISTHPYVDRNNVLRVGFGTPLEEEEINVTHFYHETPQGVRPYPQKENWQLVDYLYKNGQSADIFIPREEIELLTKCWLHKNYEKLQKILPEIGQFSPSKQAALMLLEMTEQSITRDGTFIGLFKKALKTDHYMGLVAYIHLSPRTHMVQGKEQLLVSSKTDSLETALIMRLTQPNQAHAALTNQLAIKQQNSR